MGINRKVFVSMQWIFYVNAIVSSVFCWFVARTTWIIKVAIFYLVSTQL